MRHTCTGLLAFLILLGSIMLVAFLRTPGAFLAPVAAVEDGIHMFAFYYNDRGLGSILRFYNGYTSLLPNLVGYLSPLGPTRAVPYVLALFPLLASSLALSWLSRPAYRFAIADDRTRWLACLVLALVPAASFLFVSNTMYSNWSLLLLLILLALAPPPERVATALIQLVAMAFLICSNPLSVVLLPLYACGLFLLRRGAVHVRIFYLGLIAASVMYQRFGVWSGSFTPGRLLGNLKMLPALMSDRVIFSSLFGISASRALHGAYATPLIHAASAVVLVALAALVVHYRCRLNSQQRLFGIALVYVIVGLSALYLMGRSPGGGLVSGVGAQRYWWVQRFLFVILLLFLANAFWGRGHSRPRPRAWTAVAAVGVVSWLVLLNAFNNRWYKTSASSGSRMSRFTSEVATQEATGDGSVYAVLPRGCWTIELERSMGARPGPAQPESTSKPRRGRLRGKTPKAGNAERRRQTLLENEIPAWPRTRSS